jgi:hypothetical protein
MSPMYSSSVDYDSNRLLSTDARGTQAAVLTADLRFKRALENTDISIEPRYTLRRYSDSRYGNGDERSLFAGINWQGELTTLSLTGSIWDQSTLTSELLETGIVHRDTHRLLIQGATNWIWQQTERRQLIAQFSYMDVKYYGQGVAQLPGYRYPSGSIGERFNFTERSSLTLSVFGSELASDTQGNSSREYGMQTQVIHAFSERTRFDGSVGVSKRLLSGASSYGTDAAISITQDYTRGNLSLNYTRSLVPYGFGFLVERQQLTVSGTYRLTDYVDANISAFRIKNNQLTVALHLDRPSYDSVSTGISWHPTETWNLGVQIGGIRTQAFGSSNRTVNEWRSSATLTWNPRRSARSW